MYSSCLQYKPLACRIKLITRTVQVWSEEASAARQDCFEHTDWSVFSEAADLEKYTLSVLFDVQFCADAALPVKTIKEFPNQKPWVDSTARSLLKAWDAAYRAGDRLAYSRAQSERIKQDKLQHKQRIEEHFNNNNPWSMWRDIRTMTDYLYLSSTPAPCPAAAPGDVHP